MTVGKEALTEEAIREVFNECFTNVMPMIKALQSGDLSALQSYDDIRIPEESEFTQSLKALSDAVDEAISKSAYTDTQRLSALLKLRDSCLACGINVPKEVLEELEVLTSAKPDNESKNVPVDELSVKDVKPNELPE